ncbi:nitroreductase family protein [Micromonospora echinofusca]|uniref:Nitroreductase n=1 Tax=Micromonospora echinofusca TaxID=47858 RepID=A0ABS3VVJ8_MICEH|nr:nitroreductase family protein [Micromonospora echinofusca]MBO4208496.1 nitroreductase [Micromonospora echinofusca]
MAELTPLLATRWSPRAFDPGADLTDDELTSMLEAARWAPSARNSQPWRFVVGRRDDERHKQILANLTGANQRWAGRASALLVGTYLPGSHSAYDLGQAVAHLSVQATSLGLHVHQMAGFDGDGLRASLALPAEVQPHVVVAVGRLADPATLPDDLRERETAPRQRHPLAELILP